jgi:hypothetical protein
MSVHQKITLYIYIYINIFFLLPSKKRIFRYNNNPICVSRHSLEEKYSFVYIFLQYDAFDTGFITSNNFTVS